MNANVEPEVSAISVEQSTALPESVDLEASPTSTESKPSFSAELLEPAEAENGRGTLVVVDMQAPFVSACKDPLLLASVVEQVELAVSRGWAVVLVEVKPWAYGATLAPILDLLKDKYEHYSACQKEGDDGSASVLETCARLQFDEHFFRVTGVLIGACVLSTARGLVHRRQDCLVRVMKEACGTSLEDPALAWGNFPQGDRLVVSSKVIDGSSAASALAPVSEPPVET
ncbi:MAG: hypothetical protein SFV17_27545 [Candidatus Obscuribacter sp.]|nr:hypothetical protein [Candidatus Obscuribacter sp.]